MNKPQKQTVYLPVKVEDELPNEFDIVTFIAKVPVVNQFPNLASEEEIDFSFRGWRENDKFLMHGIGEELADGKVTHWFKPQEGYFFTPEQLNEYTANVIRQALETAAENTETLLWQNNEDLEIVSNRVAYIVEELKIKQSITNTFEETFKKFKA